MLRSHPKSLLPLLLLTACRGGTGPDPVDLPIIVVGIARLDRSPVQSLTGYLAFFLDVDRNLLLEGTVQVNQLQITETVEPGIIDGPIYIRGSTVRANETYQLVATIQAPEGPIQVTSAIVTAPAVFTVQAPATLAVGQPFTVTWSPVTNAQTFDVRVVSTGFKTEVPGSATSITFPASAFMGLQAGAVAEIEISAYNGFYVTLSDISDLGDAEEAILRFTQAENITGPGTRGSFGASTTIGTTVTLQ
jgi:hypothetical protein